MDALVEAIKDGTIDMLDDLLDNSDAASTDDD